MQQGGVRAPAGGHQDACYTEVVRDHLLVHAPNDFTGANTKSKKFNLLQLQVFFSTNLQFG